MLPFGGFNDRTLKLTDGWLRGLPVLENQKSDGDLSSTLKLKLLQWNSKKKSLTFKKYLGKILKRDFEEKFSFKYVHWKDSVFVIFFISTKFLQMSSHNEKSVAYSGTHTQFYFCLI